ncbi:MAG TPA: MFS transporter [Streptosporangiaceae bacterium]|nr:MFS transporter [Streptosporangiaceae bacterium]
MTASRALFMGAVTVNALGNGLFLTISAIYFTRFGGLSVAGLGLGLTLAAGSGLAGGPWLGHQADRLGPRRIYVVLLATQAVLAALYAVCHGPALLVLLLCLAAMADRGAAAARTACVSSFVPRAERVAFRARARALSNGAAAAGAGVGALVLVAGTREAFQWAILANALTYAGAGAAVTKVRMPAVQATEAAATATATRVGARRRPQALLDARFLAVTGLNAVLLLHASMLSVGLPLWISRRTHGPIWLVSVVVVLNTVGVMVLQVPMTRRVDSVAAACTAARRAAVFLAAACVALAAAGERSGALALSLVLVTAVLHLGGEMLQAAAAWTYSVDLAPEDAQGQYQGVFNAGLDVTMLIAPAVYSWIVLAPGGWGWLALAALFAACALAFPPVTAWARRTPRLEAA